MLVNDIELITRPDFAFEKIENQFIYELNNEAAAVLSSIDLDLRQSNRTWLELSELELIQVEEIKQGITTTANNAGLIMNLYGQPTPANPIKKFESNYLASLNENIDTYDYNLQLAPNPSNIQTVVSFSLPEWTRRASIKITDQYYQMGLELGSYNIESEQSSAIIPTSNLNTGVYIVNLIVNGKIVDGKQLLVIQ